MNVKLIQDTIRDVVADCIGVHTQWEDQPRDFVDPDVGAVCLLRMPTIVPIGRDEQRLILEDPYPAKPTAPYTNLHSGYRVVTLTIKVESFDQTTGKTAVAWLEGCRTKMGWRSSGDRLNVVGVAVVRSSSPQDVTTTYDDRRTSVAVLDLILGVLFSDADPEKIQSIETADISGSFTP